LIEFGPIFSCGRFWKSKLTYTILICGDREWSDRDLILDKLIEVFLEHRNENVTVIHGDARGADTIGGELAEALGVKVVSFPANWNLYGKKAGPIRNQDMANQKPDIVLGFHDDIEHSKGTRDMRARCWTMGLPFILCSHDRLAVTDSRD